MVGVNFYSWLFCSWLSILWVLNFQDWLKEFGSFSDVGQFLMYEKFQSDLFQVWIFFDWYGLQWLLSVDFQIIHTKVLHSLLFLMLCAFINRDSWCMINSVYFDVIFVLQVLRMSYTCYRYTLSQSYSITWLLSGLIVKKLKLSFLDFREALLIKIMHAISVQLDPVMSK